MRRFVAAGTCMEYGLAARAWERIPPDSPLSPVSPYSASKASSFLMLNAFAMTNEIEFFYGRIFSAYGEGQFSGNLWPSLRKAALAGEDFLMTKGEQIRDFLPVKDVAHHLRIAAEREDISPLHPLVVNIGSGQGSRVVDFAMQQWTRLCAAGSLKPGAIPDRSSDIIPYVADLSNLYPIVKKI